MLARIAAEPSAGGPVEALAICFLYSFLAPDHERQVLERARARFPSLAIVASYEVHPEFREYERLSTTVANAYLAPRMSAYVRAFRRRVEELGIPALPYINQSNGGTMSVEEAARVPVRTALSGPSAGVAGRGVDRGPGGLRRHRHLRHGRHQHRRRLRPRRDAGARPSSARSAV